MGIFILSTTFLICVTWSTIFSPGSAISLKKALNTGDDITLDCVTDWNPNITLYWIQRTVGSLGDRYIATAGPQNENGFIWQRFQENSCFSYSYENVSSSEMKISLALYISNIADEDSANYTCVSYQKGSLEPKLLYTYDVRAIDCNCFLESNVVCDLFGLHMSDSLPVYLRIGGRTVTGMVNNSRLELSSRLLNESIHRHSIVYTLIDTSSEGILSNISCTLPIESTTTVFSTQPDPSPDISSEDSTSLLPNTTPPPSWQPSTPTAVGSQLEDRTSEPNTTTSAALMYTTQVQLGITNYESRSSSTMTIAFSIITILALSVLVTLVVLVVIRRRKLRSHAGQPNVGELEGCHFTREGTLNMTRNPMHAGKEDSALPYPKRLEHIPQHITDASASPDYYEEVDGYLQGEDNSCCTVLNVENEYTYLYMAPLKRDVGMGGYMNLIVSDENASGNLAPDDSDENASGNLAPSVTGENRENYTFMGPIVGDDESNAEGYVICNVTRDEGEKVYPVPDVTGLGASRITSSNMNENDYLVPYVLPATQCRYDLLLPGGGRRNYETRRDEEESFVVSVAAKTTPIDLAPIEKELQG